jgi:EpsI family protein
MSLHSSVRHWIPAILLGLGCILLFRIGEQDEAPLRAPLAQLPDTFNGFESQDVEVSAEERAVAGVSDYLMRVYMQDSLLASSLYVGYYSSQVQGKTIHSPKNCLPGAGWDPISAEEKTIDVLTTSYRVNRYILGKGTARALVYYWYQGRGRISANEYAVKWELLRDKARAGRSEEALVRIVVPIRTTEEEAEEMAIQLARDVIDPLFSVLPAFPRKATEG